MKSANYKVCDQCGGSMSRQTTSHIFHLHGKEIEIRGIESYKCDTCGEVVFSASEARMIEKILHAMDNKPTVDVLNLDETAEYLRVSNQTVYNMIRDGRIKAYKVGREWRFLRADIMAYLDSASSDSLYLAAKGGKVDSDDFKIIKNEIEKRNTTNE